MSLLQPKIQATNITLSVAQGDYLMEKLAQIGRLLPSGETAVMCEVELEKTTKHHKSGQIFRAEINLTFGRTFLRAEATSESIEQAIDEVKGEIKAEVRKMNEKRDTSVKKGGRKMKQIMRGE